MTGTAVEIARNVYLNDNTGGLSFEIDDYDNAVLTKADGSRFVVGTEYDDDSCPDGYTYTSYSGDGEEIAQDGDSTLDSLDKVITNWVANG